MSDSDGIDFYSSTCREVRMGPMAMSRRIRE
jgi:hypothetical protein